MINCMFTSRRDKHKLCLYWKQDESEYYDKNEIGHVKQPSGKFYAKETNAQQDGAQTVGGVFMIDSSVVSLKTDDNISNMRKNDIVKYNNEMWRVTNIQKRPIRKNNQFMKDMIYTYYIDLKK